ncbi:MAG: fibrillarin-like rRNA/tRNA 2'-O-methyltransferase [Candidatus Micrarchaeia archaeon]|jgi:fibrillarin-like pre-rRNA processing protein
MRFKERFPGIFSLNGKLATRALARGSLFGEAVKKEGGVEYRLWDPKRSKLAAAIVKGLRNCPIAPGARVLYLGAANGYTASFASDVVGVGGALYCVEKSARAMRDLIFVCEKRENMYPILADARLPEEYVDAVPRGVDVLYEDVAAPDQTQILLRNAAVFKPKWVMYAVKARSINSLKPPKQVYAEQREALKQWVEVTDFVVLDPFEADHCFIAGKYQG